MTTFPLKFKTSLDIQTKSLSDLDKAISSLISINLSEEERDRMLKLLKSIPDYTKDEDLGNKE